MSEEQKEEMTAETVEETEVVEAAAEETVEAVAEEKPAKSSKRGRSRKQKIESVEEKPQ